ncbi:MAG: class I SAM-dependent methyltransferase, partial [Caldilineae bacterium]
MPFDPVARFYDLDDGRLVEDIPAMLAFAQKTGGPVLELGVGTGRLALALARAGYAVVGVDSAAGMLAIA